MIRYPDGSVRYSTVREVKRIQTFPDSFVIKGAWSEAMRQIRECCSCVAWGNDRSRTGEQTGIA